MNYYPAIIQRERFGKTDRLLAKVCICDGKSLNTVKFVVSNPDDINDWYIVNDIPVMVQLNEPDQFCKFVGTMMKYIDIESIVPDDRYVDHIPADQLKPA